MPTSTAMAFVRPQMLVMLLALSMACAATIDVQDLECSPVKNPTKDTPIVLGSQATRSIRFNAPNWNKKWIGVLQIAERNFTHRFNLELKKSKDSSHFTYMKLYKIKPMEIFLNHRIQSSWFENGLRAVMYINGATLHFVFQSNSKTLSVQLTDPHIEGLDAVWGIGDIETEVCDGPERVPEPTTTTTTTTTVPTTTTTTTTSTTTTTTPTTTTVATTSTATSEAPMTTQDDATTTTEEQSLYSTMEESKNDTGASSASTDTTYSLGGNAECHTVPLWAWVCAALAALFFLIILVLTPYTVILYKRSRWGDRIRKTDSSGAFGVSAQEIHYFEMNNPNLMIGNTVPRVKTPRPTSSPGLTPRHSLSGDFQESSSTRSLTPNTLSPPVLGRGSSTNEITDIKEKKSVSRISFADEL